MDKKINFGCSSIKLTSKNNNYYYFRTCDMNDESNVWKAGSKVISFNKNYPFNFSNKEKIKSKYALLGITFGTPYERLLDGINEKGLSGGLLHYIEGTSIDKTKDINKKGVEGMEIITYFLSQCANVNEVINLASSVVVTHVIQGDNIVPATMHYTFLDTSGESIILEADDSGNFTIYNKTVGVFTNSPGYKEHINNLSWYIASSLELSQGRKGSPPIKKFLLDGVEVIGNSSKKNYIRSDVYPGTYTSIDRFIRLSTLKHLIKCGKIYNDDEILLKGSEIISSVIVPRHQGYFYYNYLLATDKENANYKDHDVNGNIIYGGGDNYTQYIVMYDLKNKSLYIKTDKSLVYDKITLNNKINNFIIHDINNNPLNGIINHN